MNGYLRQSTASQVRTIGPFVDDTDFKTLKNALSIANTDILLKKNGAASAAKNSGGATADGAGGLYAVTWDATDTGTVGELVYSVKVAGALVAFGSYVVLEEAVYDALYAASAAGYQTPVSFPTNFSSLSIDANGRAKIQSEFNLNVAFTNLQFKMVDSAGNAVEGLVNGDFTAKLYSLGGGAQGTLSGTITEDPGGEGFYLISLIAGELNAKSVAFTFEATGTAITSFTVTTAP